MKKSVACMLASVAVMMATGALAQDVIKLRKDGFEGNKKAMAEIKAVFEKGAAVTDVAVPAGRMAAFGAQIPGLFPPGSDKGKTDAKPEIWTNMADFTAKAKAFEMAAAKLQEVAMTGDKAATMKQFATVGGTCKGCHETYRED